MRDHQTVVPARFSGFPGIALGGYIGGVVAARVGAPAAEVSLRRPVPTGVALTLESNPGRAELRDGEVLVAEGSAADMKVDVPEPVGLAEAEAASHRYPGFHHHLYPGCFGCGPEHADGLRIFPGPIPGRRLVAAPWVPGSPDADERGTIPIELVWAAFDCPQLWSLILHAPSTATEKLVTGALAVRVERPITVGEPHVVMAWPSAREGRKLFAGAALLGPDGEVCATALQTALCANWGIPLGLARWSETPLPR